MHVSAKELTTGKEQSITITSNTNLSKEEIDKAVRDAEQYAEEDKKRREVVDVRNGAETLVYSVEKSVEELGDKITADEKSNIQSKIEAVKEAIKGDDVEMIKKAQEELQKAFYPVYEKLSQQAAQAQGAQGAAPQQDAGQQPQDGVYDADYRDVDDDKKE